MKRFKPRPKRTVTASTRSERQIIANKHRLRMERKKNKHRHIMLGEEEMYR